MKNMLIINYLPSQGIVDIDKSSGFSSLRPAPGSQSHGGYIFPVSDGRCRNNLYSQCATIFYAIVRGNNLQIYKLINTQAENIITERITARRINSFIESMFDDFLSLTKPCILFSILCWFEIK